MAKREIVFLLLPSALFVGIALLALGSSNEFSLSPKLERFHKQNIEEFMSKVKSGELQPTREKWMDLLRESEAVQQAVVDGHAKLMRILGYGVLAAVALQGYVIFRVRAVSKTPSPP